MMSNFREPKIVISNSVGVITLVDVTSTGLVPTNQWKAHDFEAWITAFNYHNTNIVYSGSISTLTPELKVFENI